MTGQTIKAQAQQLVAQGKDLAAEGNKRQLVFSRETQPLFAVKLTVALAIALIALVTGIVSMPLIVITSIVAYLWGVRVHLRQLAVVLVDTV